MKNSLISTVCAESEWNEGFTIPLFDRVFDNSLCDEMVIIDSSKRPIQAVSDWAKCRNGELNKVTYHWTKGYNTYYGGSINLAIELIGGENVIYFSSKRVKIYDDRWIERITAPLSDPICGMAGCTEMCDYTRIHGHDNFKAPNAGWHVQGGVWAARSEVMRKYPYSHRFPQVLSDVWISAKLQDVGMRLVDVPEIRSVPTGVVENPQRFMLVCDYS